jgi:P-type E1-E2 ATPase
MGGSNNVCSDKTGTLTKNRMTVVATYFEDRIETDSLPHIPMENSTKELFSEK